MWCVWCACVVTHHLTPLPTTSQSRMCLIVFTIYCLLVLACLLKFQSRMYLFDLRLLLLCESCQSVMCVIVYYLILDSVCHYMKCRSHVVWRFPQFKSCQ